ncbi:restriction endonuclease subunit S [Leclercia adecarboxylata]|uniref:restriction endonuclease subunit S n=1 Tax=Leclercia adecarboxylata TaxID=83655 RepID=UPI002DBC1F53|nr:restriction endonuclease subunit S [Leclercia adecarboxylata]MEB6379738.1 restriction endonuclease subunit S [Leclercia adecarboxylata]
MSGRELPEEWITSKFTELMDVQGGTQPPKSEFISENLEGYIRLLQIRDFGNKPVPTYIPVANKLKTCRKEDLLIGRYGASLGRICTGQTGAYNVALAKVIYPHEFERSFVRYYLESELFQSPLRLLSRSAQNGFNKDDLSKFNFLLTSLFEQKIIAEKLDTLLAQVDSTKARLEKIPQILKRFRQAVLNSAMSGSLINKAFTNSPKKIGAYVSIDIGHAFKSTEFSESGIPLLRGKNIEPGALRWDETKKLPLEKLHDFEHLFIKEGDIILAMDRPIISSGLKLAKAKKSDLPCVLVQRVARFKNYRNLLPEYLFLALSHLNFENYIQPNQTGSDIPHISGKQIMDFKCTIPDLKEQAEIVRRVEQLFAYADTIEKQVNTALERVNNLTQSILAKAFRGELTAQWRAENPDLITGENSAAALLEKIKAERATSGTKKTARKKS